MKSIAATILAVCLALSFSGCADHMMNDGMKSDSMSKGDGMKDDGMKKDGMMKDDGKMKK